MLSRKPDFLKINDFEVFSALGVTLNRLSTEIDFLTLTFTKSLCVVLLSPAETSLMLTLCGNDFIKELLFFALADILHKNN